MKKITTIPSNGVKDKRNIELFLKELMYTVYTQYILR